MVCLNLCACVYDVHVCLFLSYSIRIPSASVSSICKGHHSQRTTSWLAAERYASCPADVVIISLILYLLLLITIGESKQGA